MPAAKSRDLYMDELNDLYDVEQHILQELEVKMAKTRSADLRRLVEVHLSETREHVRRLGRLCHEVCSASGPQNVPDSGDVRARDTEQPKTTEPRIERYQDR